MTAERMSLVPFTPQANRPSWIEAMDRGSELAEMIANTDFVPRSLRGNPPAILAAILYGHEIGLEPMRSLAWVHVIEGRPALAAAAQRALILAAGHELVVEESTGARATVAGRRRDGKTTSRVTWTLDDAKRAGLAGKPSWQRYPRAMLVQRATSELAQQLFADVIGGIPSTAELDVYDGDVDEAEVVPEPQQPKATRQRKRPTPAPPEHEGPEPEPAEPDPPSEPQKRKMFALTREKFPDADRATRLEWIGNTIGRAISSSNELSSLEVGQVIEALEAAESPPVQMPDAGGGTSLPENEQALIDEAKAAGAVEVSPDRVGITEQQRRRISGLFRDLRVEDAEARRAFCANVLDRPLESAEDMNDLEANRVLEALEQQLRTEAEQMRLE